MPLTPGDAAATSGMAKAIYDQIDAALSPSLPPDAPPDIRESWRKLSFAVATGVVASLRRDAGDADFAEVVSTNSDDARYWAWLAGFVKLFQNWAPVAADGIALKQALTTFLAANAVPNTLRGSLR